MSAKVLLSVKRRGPRRVKEYVLDTHAFVWWATQPRRIGKAAARALREVDAGRAQAWIPSAVAIELTRALHVC